MTSPIAARSRRSGSRHPHFTLDDDQSPDTDDVESPPIIVVDAEAAEDGQQPGDRPDAAAALSQDHFGSPANVHADPEPDSNAGYPPKPREKRTQSVPDEIPDKVGGTKDSATAHGSLLHRFQHAIIGTFDQKQWKPPHYLEWTVPHLNWKGIRPVVRSSVAAWAGLTLILCGPSERMLGQASFLTLIVSSISPAAYPIVTMLELTLFQILLVSVSPLPLARLVAAEVDTLVFR